MKSRSSIPFLQRIKLLSARRNEPPYEVNASKSHQRPVRPLPDLLPEDSPAHRVATQVEADREAYLPEPLTDAEWESS